MAVTPTSSLATKIELARLMVARCASFQARVGASNTTEALERVHDFIGGSVGDAVGLMPFAIVGFDGEQASPANSVNSFWCEGTIEIQLYDRERHPGAMRDGRIDFMNFWGGVYSEIQAQLGGSDAVLNMRSVRITGNPARSPDDPVDDEANGPAYYQGIIYIDYG